MEIDEKAFQKAEQAYYDAPCHDGFIGRPLRAAIEAYEAAKPELTALVNEMAEVLKWYADPKNWKLEIGYNSDGNPESVLPNAYFTDKGESARAVLAKAQSKVEGL